MSSDEPEEVSQKKIKSGKARVMSFIRFFNRTMKKVDVIWINYEGQCVKYRTLEVEEYVDVNTFVGHPWVFRDSITGDKMVVQLKQVYNPQPWNIEGVAPRRRIVNITIPVYTLKERSMQVVRKLFSRSAIPRLEIPQSLITDLLHTSGQIETR